MHKGDSIFDKEIVQHLLSRNLLSLLLIAVVLASPVQASASQNKVSWLHTFGRSIFDETGNTFRLYGVNFVYGEGQGLTLTDIKNAKDMGFNAFRLQVYWGLIQPLNEQLNGVDQSYFTVGKPPLGVGLDTVVNWAVQENMYFIICLSWDAPWWPPPEWAFPGMSNDSQRFMGLIGGTSAREKIGVLNTWKFIADRYKDVPNVIFELLNEPSVPVSSLASIPYKTLNEQIISGIESVEKRSHLVLVQLLMNDQNGSWIEFTDEAAAINKPNVVWATHHYAPMNSWNPSGRYWHDSFRWNGQTYAEGWGNGTVYAAWRVVRVADRISSWNAPWISTEMSKNLTQSHWDQWYQVVLGVMASYHISGWAYFCYSRMVNTENGWNIHDPTTATAILPLLGSYEIS
jgi:Cellulase (glycosyl hydrolase family 5)